MFYLNLLCYSIVSQNTCTQIYTTVYRQETYINYWEIDFLVVSNKISGMGKDRLSKVHSVENALFYQSSIVDSVSYSDFSSKTYVYQGV